jgi:hypothetical protein
VGPEVAVTIVAPPREHALEYLEGQAVIKEARQRQHRRRWLVAGVALVAALSSFVAVSRTTPRPQTPASLLARPLHFPSLGPGGSCPASRGTTIANSYFGGVAIGKGPVRVLIANQGDLRRGRAELGTTEASGWFALQTLWLSTPGYGGPFVVRAERLGGKGPIEVQPSGSGLFPGAGPLVVPAGPTANTRDGYRTVPGSTWVTSSGCYAWQVDGLNFSEIIVVDALPHV